MNSIYTQAFNRVTEIVTDYLRDLEEMQNVSREDYLASLRRKSSGISKGISKYLPLSSYVGFVNFYDFFHLFFPHHSSRWDPQSGCIPGVDYINSTHYGGNVSGDNEYVGGFGWIERLICRVTSSGGEKLNYSNDIGNELRAAELLIWLTEPYEMRRFRSAAYKSFKQKVAKKKEKVENENKLSVM
ncbi:AP2-like ethylene-responsive transcription factor At2g41710 [Nicotiana sylvestris]|uniref:AP2-like ethylene-responsive transcription factor At2g41710 n=1 Tax=Nicotiana sylvestris TaxID=4096 RepID=UPI00388C7597